MAIKIELPGKSELKFNPETFDPENNHNDDARLSQLRNQGWIRLGRWCQARRCGYEPKTTEDVTTFASTAFQHIVYGPRDLEREQSSKTK
jgi:hypothetical protein